MELNDINEYKQPEGQPKEQGEQAPISPRADSFGQIDPYSNTYLEDIENEDPRYGTEDLSNLPSHQEAPNPQFEYKDSSVYYGGAKTTEDSDNTKDQDRKQKANLSTNSNQAQESRRGYSIDWNKDFQELLKLPENTKEEKLRKNLKISSLSRRFVSMAKRLGKIIISEAYLNDQLTIPATQIGGQAGGKKYMYNGILFKLQTDWMGIYGGDFYAMKAGGLELKGLMRYYGCENLHVPLMCVIDYRGFRLIAESFLPINKASLAYGSHDGGVTVMDLIPELSQAMRLAGERLNIKGHMCGRTTTATKKFLYGPTDIEGHLGSDGRFYVVDFARVFPPTAEAGVRKTFLYRTFRPEFVKNNPKPLSSDAFSPFNRSDPNEQADNLEVQQATQQLLEGAIPRFSKWLEDYYKELNLHESLSPLTELIHREGINVRYFGVIRGHLNKDSTELRNYLLLEMMARVVKNQIGERFRITVKKAPTLDEDPFMDIVLDTFNKILDWSKESPLFWDILKIEIEKYFRNSLEASEKHVDFDLKHELHYKQHCTWLLFKRIQQLTGIRLTKRAQNELKNNPRSVKLVVADIKKIGVSVKRMNIISLAEGNALAIQAMDAIDEATEFDSHHDRLFRLAMDKFEQAIRSTPDNTSMLNHYAQVLITLADRKARAGEESFPYFEKAFQKYNVARNLEGLLQLGNTLQSLNDLVLHSQESRQLLGLACKCYDEVIRLDDMQSEALRRYGDLLVKIARRQTNEACYKRAGGYYRKSVELQGPLSEFGWLAPVLKKFNDTELSIVVEAVTRDQGLVFDASKCFNKTLITDNCIVELTAANNHFLSINLASSPVTDAALSSIGKHCKLLKSLDLSRCNEITDKGLTIAVSGCTNLETIKISYCSKLTGESLKFVMLKNQHLKRLEAAGCTAFAEDSISHFGKCAAQGLTYLDLTGARFLAETFCRSFKTVNLKKLETLILVGCVDLNDACLVLLSQSAVNLKTISLANCPQLNDEAIHAVAQHCKKLEHLDLTKCAALRSKSLASLGSSISTLKSLVINECTKIYNDPKSVTLCLNAQPALEKLCAKFTRLDDQVINQLKGTAIKEIDLEGTSVTKSALLQFVTHNNNLLNFCVNNCHGIDDQIVEMLAKNSSTTLRSLGVSGGKNFTEKAFAAIASCSELTDLDLSLCTKLTDASIEKIAHGCPQLTVLNVKGCNLLTNQALSSLGSRSKNLKLLNCSKCYCITSVGSIADGCPNLEELILTDCQYITEESMFVLDKCEKLKILDVFGCRYVTDNLLKHVEGFSALEELQLGMNKIMDQSHALKELQTTKPSLRVVQARHGRTVDQPVNALDMSAGGTAITPQNSSALRSLLRDLKEIEKNPLPLVAALPLESTMFVWHCNLKGPENTPYAGAIFHIQLTFPSTYPSTPPSASILTQLPHPHVHNDKICLDILSDFQTYFEENKSGPRTSGWSSAYTVQTILLQLQAFLMEYKEDSEGRPLDQYLSKIPQAIKAAHQFQCTTCAHQPGAPWPPFHVDDMHKAKLSEAEMLKEDLKCFHSRVPFTEDVLGIGISIKYSKRNRNIEAIESPLDLLSYTAFNEGVRESVYNFSGEKYNNYTHWLPVFINKEHGERALPLMKKSLSLMCTGRDDKFTPDMALSIFPKLMNTMIVGVMRNKTLLSIKALEGYLTFQRWMIHFVNEYPELLKQANKLVSDFINYEENRLKKNTPALGEFLPLLTITPDITWKDVSRPYIDECFIRNYRWVIEKWPDMERSSDESVANRIGKTLLASSVSLRLNCFHVFYLEKIARPKGRTLEDLANDYDAHYGRPTHTLKELFLEGVKIIKNINTWEEIFKGLNLPQPNDQELSKWLKKSAEISGKRGYHGKGSSGGGGQGNRNSLNLSGSTDNLPTSPPAVSPRSGTNPWTNNNSNNSTPNLKRSHSAQNKATTPKNNNNKNVRRSTNSSQGDSGGPQNNVNSGYYQAPAYYTDPYYYNGGYNASYYDNTTDTTYYNTEIYDNEYYNQGGRGYYDALANSNYMLDYSAVAPDSASEGNSSENSSENGDWQEVSYKKPTPSNNHVNRGRGRGQLKRPFQNKRQ